MKSQWKELRRLFPPHKYSITEYDTIKTTLALVLQVYNKEKLPNKIGFLYINPLAYSKKSLIWSCSIIIITLASIYFFFFFLLLYFVDYQALRKAFGGTINTSEWDYIAKPWVLY